MSLARIGVCAVVLVLTACTAPSSEAPSPSGTPFSVGGQAAAIGCGDDIDLRASDGRVIDLTGLWTEPDFSDTPRWNIRQVGDCFFMVYRPPPGLEDPEYFDQLCDGRIRIDYTITGRCIDFIHRSGPGVISGQADLQPQIFRILFDDANEVQLQRCPASLAPGSCEVPMIRFDPENVPAESASPS